MKNINSQQIQFADEYIKTGNALQSAISAGYSEKYAKSQSSKLLENVGIKSYIKEKMKEIESNKIMDAKEAMELLTRIARGEEKETKVVTTQFDVSIVEVPSDNKTKMIAVKELLKRFLDNDKLLEAQIKCAEPEKLGIMNSSANNICNLLVKKLSLSSQLRPDRLFYFEYIKFLPTTS